MDDLDLLFMTKEQKEQLKRKKIEEQQQLKEQQEKEQQEKDEKAGYDFNKNPFLYDLKEFDRKKFICLPYKREIDRIIKENFHSDASSELLELYEKYINMGDFLGADSCRKGLVTLGSQFKDKSPDIFADYINMSKRIELDPRYIGSRRTFIFLQKKYQPIENKPKKENKRDNNKNSKKEYVYEEPVIERSRAY
jgi:hypothetical protein